MHKHKHNHPIQPVAVYCRSDITTVLNKSFRCLQVLNDLLDPSRANLKLREDPKRGFYVEGIKEETLVSAEHALSVIATGVAHRKVHIVFNRC